MGRQDADLFRRTAQLAVGWLQSLDSRPVRARATVAELRSRLAGSLPANPSDPLVVVQDLARRRNRAWLRYRPAATSASLSAAVCRPRSQPTG